MIAFLNTSSSEAPADPAADCGGGKQVRPFPMANSPAQVTPDHRRSTVLRFMLPCLLVLLPLTAMLVHADVTLNGMFKDHMVLQRGMQVPVWGWAAPGEQVAVSAAGQTQTATADADGKWMVRLDPIELQEPLPSRATTRSCCRTW
jgi:hypothetical protein